ncbi:hypothetical protein EDB89DRAFT_1517853 [Lactarius sanguifluus]|nr:hypothetical protein EDB89DRAFT_1517853 [Lactarius sanguifluus]
MINIEYRSYDHLDLPTLQQIHELRGNRVHFVVPLGEHKTASTAAFSSPSTTLVPTSRVLKKKGNKTWFEQTKIPTSQITELDWWDVCNIPICVPRPHQFVTGPIHTA